MIHKAGQLGLRVVIPFVNNWNDFGGMDQYVRWRGGQFHDEFYTDPVDPRLVPGLDLPPAHRVNTHTGVAYKDDATIMAWELANEPRCRAYGVYPSSATCTTQTLIDWADEMRTFVKGIDRRHLLSVGDEGFFCIPGRTDWTENCGEGVDTLALAELRHIDVDVVSPLPGRLGQGRRVGHRLDRAAHPRVAAHSASARCSVSSAGATRPCAIPCTRSGRDTVLRSGGDRRAVLDPVGRPGRRHALPGLRRLHRLLPEPRVHDVQQLRGEGFSSPAPTRLPRWPTTTRR